MSTSQSETDRANGSSEGKLQASMRRTMGRRSSLHKYGLAYVIVILVVVFSLADPSVFPRTATIWGVLNSNAIDALAALALVTPFAGGLFDISVPYTMTLSGMLAAYGIVQWHMPIAIAIAIGLVASILVGVANSFVIVAGGVDSLIGTLAMGFVIQSVVSWVSGGQTITGPSLIGSFQSIAFATVGNTITLPVLYAVVLGFAVWYLLERTITGRRIYATGFKAEAARLAGVKTRRLRVACLMLSSLLAGVTGVVLAANLGAGQPDAGTSYLLPAFAALFLGATQVIPGRFNSRGTLLAVLMLGTLAEGMALLTAPAWSTELVEGGVLLFALVLQQRDLIPKAWSGLRSRGLEADKQGNPEYPG